MYPQSKGADVKQALAGSVGDGVEDLCNCEFSASNLKQIVLQCYSDYPAKIFVLLTIQVTATKSLPDILNFITDWIARDLHIVLGESNTTVYIDKLCDITILGSECVPTSSSSSSAEIPSNNPTTAASKSQTEGLKAGIGVLAVFTVVIPVMLVVVLVVFTK